MAETVIMPKLGLQMTVGLITEWHVAEGDTVRKGDPLFAVETDKLASEVESTADGVVLQIVAPEGSEVPVAEPVCYIGQPGERPGGAPAAETPAAPEAPDGAPAAEAPSEAPAARLLITPCARRLCRELGIDPAAVRGTGPRGRIQRDDVLACRPAAPAPAPGPAEAWRKPLSGMRRTVGRRLLESKTTIPHVYFEDRADATALQALRRQLAEAALRKNGTKLTVNDFVLKATATALAEFPALNVRLDGDELVGYDSVSLGMAVAVEDGLLVPVIPDAAGRSLSELSVAAADLAARARSGKLTLDEISGSTFTVSNLGGYGLERFHAIINPPEVGILAVGAIRDRVVAVDGRPEVRPMMCLSASFDHRLVDGALAAQFLARVRALLESPAELLL